MNIYYKNMNINSHGVTGSCNLLTIQFKDKSEYNIIVDFGQVQNQKLRDDEIYKVNSRDYVLENGLENFENVDLVIITHSHSDHMGLLGRIPTFEKFKGKIITTELTAKLGSIILDDGLKLHTKQVDKLNKNRMKYQKYQPYMTLRTVDMVKDMIRCYSYNQEIELTDRVKVKLLPSGHISGSAMALIEITEGREKQRVLFSGDTSGLGRRELPFTMTPDVTKLKVNHLITEATYNNRRIPNTNVVEELTNHIQETCLSNRKSIAIPVFSVARSTNMLWYLREVYNLNPEFKKIPIYFCSPMACKAHKVICSKSSIEYYDNKWKDEIDILNWDNVNYVESFDKLQQIMDDRKPAIYCSSSGMISGGYIMHIISKLLTRKKNKIIFCGFQAEKTLGRNLLDGIQKNISITDEKGKKKSYPIKADICKIDGMSSHCDYVDLANMWKTMERKKMKNIILNHGDSEGMETFENELRKYFKSECNMIKPKYKERIRLK